ncbi:MAG: metallophosphoesterase [Parcubacteria group bacterium]|jgi:hypothetical protein
MASKKITIIASSIISIAAVAGLGYFIIAPSPAKTTGNAPTQNQITPELESFQGVLAGVLEGIEENTGKIPEVLSNPFAKKEGAAASPAPSSGENNFTFAILGDTQRFTAGNKQGNFQKATANIKKQNPNMIIAVGDLVSNCKGKSDDAQNYDDWKNILGALTSKTYAVQGNHDRVENLDKCDRIWQDTFNFPTNGPSGFSELTYSLDFKNSHFVFLDSNKPDAHQVNDAQRDWLEQDLTKNKKENTFVIFHEPAYPTGYKSGESLDVEPSQRNALWEILDRHNVTAVFNGHEHIASRRKIDSQVSSAAKNSIYQFVFGNTDSFDHTLPAPGIAEYANQGQGRYGIVKVSGKEITVETRGPNGEILDTFAFSK